MDFRARQIHPQPDPPDAGTEQLTSHRGRFRGAGQEAHAQIAEREATHRAISHAQLIDVPIVIVHVSGRDPMEQIQWARGRGLKVHAETCPQYIALTAEDLRGLNMDFEGTKYVCSPPPRDADSQAAIWQRLRDGTFDIFSSDHCPFRFHGEASKDNPRARTSFK